MVWLSTHCTCVAQVVTEGALHEQSVRMLCRACRYRRYVCEDRWTAIRWAIGSAQADDCVVIAGRGHKDSVEWAFLGEPVRVRLPG